MPYYEENKFLSLRVEQLEAQSRANNLVIHGLPESTYAEPSTNAEADNTQKAPSRRDTIQCILKCCNSKLGVAVSENDISAGFRIPGIKNAPRPIVVTFTSKSIRDKVHISRKLLRKQDGGPRIYINEHLTKGSSGLFAKGRALLREGKIASVWTLNGNVYVKRIESDRPSRISSMEDLQKYQ